MKKFSDRLKYLLNLKKMNAAAFSRISDIPETSVGKIIKGERKPGIEIAEKIIKALNLTPNEAYWLMTGDDLTPSDKSEALTETFQRALDGDQAAIKEIDIKISELKLKYK